MRRFRARGHGLDLSVVEWSPESVRSTCLLLHGFMDSAESFDRVVPALVACGLRVVAPDLRGFGDSDWVSGGGYYHFSDYVADVDALVREHVEGELVVIGHSMGGTVATQWVGARPERVAKLALLEGLGPPDNEPQAATFRTHRWLEQLATPPTAVVMTRAEALERLTVAHPRIARDVLATRLPHLLRSEGDGFTWKYDPMHRTTSPAPFFARVYEAFAARVACPVLYVSGGTLGWRVPDEAERLAAFGVRPIHVDLPEAGHMMHWTQPEGLGHTLAEFFGVSVTASR